MNFLHHSLNVHDVQDITHTMGFSIRELA